MRLSLLGLLGAAALLTASLVGCSSGGPTGEAVQGTVTLDGAPLPTGNITFLPVDGQGPTAGAEIKGGQYQTKAAPGAKKVLITANKVTGQQKAYPNDPNSPVFDIQEQYIPAQYNTNTELKCEIKPGKNTCDFPLKSK